MAVCVGHLSCLSHEILEVLPGSRRGEVFHDHPVASPGARGPPTASPPATIAVAIIPPVASSVLNSDPSPVKVLPVQILDSVISITPVIKLGKAKSLLYRDVPDPAIALQELLYVPGGNNS